MRDGVGGPWMEMRDRASSAFGLCIIVVSGYKSAWGAGRRRQDTVHTSRWRSPGAQRPAQVVPQVRICPSSRFFISAIPPLSSCPRANTTHGYRLVYRDRIPAIHRSHFREYSRRTRGRADEVQTGGVFEGSVGEVGGGDADAWC